MFPDFRYLIHGLFGINPPEWVGLFKTFGLMVALSFLAATYVMISEMRRRERMGLLRPQYDPVKKVNIWPHERISEIVMISAIGGFAGAKIFNAFETWNEFIRDPMGSLFSRSGFTFYGGLIVSIAVFYYFAKKHKISLLHLYDCSAPAVMIAYGIGRLGCQLSGDGDWGIYNSAYITQVNGSLKVATRAESTQAMQSNAAYYIQDKGSLENVPTAYAPGPSWAPTWLMAQNYAHNVGHEGMSLAGCTGDYCTVLPMGVFPTPMYECVVCIGLFFLMWAIRKRVKYVFHMSAIYFILNGLERFFVELIRVNYKYDWGFIHPTQAEIIAVLFVLTGIGIILFYRKLPKIEAPLPEAQTVA